MKRNKKSSIKTKANPKSKGKLSDLSTQFGGLSVHKLDIEPINVFALKVEHCEEIWSPSCPVPVGPGPFN